MTLDDLIRANADETLTIQGSNRNGWTATHSYFPYNPAHGRTVKVALERLRGIVKERRKTHWSDFVKKEK